MRLTFSKSIAKFLCTYDKSYSYRKFKFRIGDVADKDSKNCLFAIVSYTGYVLRMATHYENAEILCDGNYRHVYKAYLEF